MGQKHPDVERASQGKYQRAYGTLNPAEQRDFVNALRQGKLDGRYVDVETADRNMPMVEVFSNAGLEELGINFKDMLGGLFPKGVKRRRGGLRWHGWSDISPT